MTDPETADVTYIEPLNVERLEQIIQKERPDALLPNLGGQSGLNLCAELNGPGKGCHSCDAACSCGTKKAEPDVEKIVAEVTKKILEQMK